MKPFPFGKKRVRCERCRNLREIGEVCDCYVPDTFRPRSGSFVQTYHVRYFMITEAATRRAEED